MPTAVQLLPAGSPRATLTFGAPVRTIPGARGPIAIFEAGQVVAYLLDHRRTRRLYVFRTVTATSSELVEIAGVHPGADLLILARHRATITRLSKVFGLLAITDRAVDSIPDDFWLRLAGVITRPRPFTRTTLAHILAQASPSPAPPRADPDHRGHDRPLHRLRAPHVEPHTE